LIASQILAALIFMLSPASIAPTIQLRANGWMLNIGKYSKLAGMAHFSTPIETFFIYLAKEKRY